MLDGFTFDDKGIWVDGASMPEWHEHLNAILTRHDLYVFRKFDIAAVIDKVKQQYVEHYSTNIELASLTLYRTLQPEYKICHI